MPLSSRIVEGVPAAGFEITVEYGGDIADVRVVAGPAARVGALAAALAQRHGRPVELWHPAGRLDPGAPLDECGLVAGDTVRVLPAAEAGRPMRPNERGAFYLQVVAGKDSGRREWIPVSGELTVGTLPDNGLKMTDELISRRHANFWRTEHGAAISARDTKNGTRVGDTRVVPGQTVQLRAGDLVWLGPHTCLAIMVTDQSQPYPSGALSTTHRPVTAGRSQFHRGVRQVAAEPPPFPRPPQISHTQGGMMRWVIRAGLTGGASVAVIGVVEHSVTALLIGVVPVIASVASMFITQSMAGPQANHRRELDRYNRQTSEYRAWEIARLGELAPPPDQVAHTAETAAATLWERRPMLPQGVPDPTYLSLRLGIGEQWSQLPSGPGDGVTDPFVHQGVPVTVALPTAGAVGLSGPAGPARALARWLVMQAAVQSGPADLSIAILADPDDPAAVQDWQWARWLPHAQTADGVPRLTRVGDHAQLSTLLERIHGSVYGAFGGAGGSGIGIGQTGGGGRRPGPAATWLLVVDGFSHREPRRLAELLAAGPQAGVHAIILRRSGDPMVEHAQLRVEISAGATSVSAAVGVGTVGTVGATATLASSPSATLRDARGSRVLMVDQVDESVASRTARALARLRDNTLGQARRCPRTSQCWAWPACTPRAPRTSGPPGPGSQPLPPYR